MRPSICTAHTELIHVSPVFSTLFSFLHFSDMFKPNSVKHEMLCERDFVILVSAGGNSREIMRYPQCNSAMTGSYFTIKKRK